MTAPPSGTLGEQLAVNWTRRPVEAVPKLAELHAAPRPQTAEVPEDGVVLIGYSVDQHLDALAGALARRGVPWLRLEVDRRPSAGWLAYQCSVGARHCRGVFLREINAARPIAYHNETCVRTLEPWEALGPRVRQFASSESHAALLGWLARLDAGRWVNGYWEAQRAEVKPAQLALAAEHGLLTPRSLVTDNAATARRFFEQVGGELIYKALGDPLVWEENGAAGFLYTSVIDRECLDRLGSSLCHPGLFQERLRVRAEYRVVVVGDQLFTARVAASAGEPDWRRRLLEGVPFERAALDQSVEAAVLRTVGAAGLAFAAVDLAETADGIYFLELNPSGAYRWLENQLELPISEAICEELAA